MESKPSSGLRGEKATTRAATRSRCRGANEGLAGMDCYLTYRRVRRRTKLAEEGNRAVKGRRSEEAEEDAIKMDADPTKDAEDLEDGTEDVAQSRFSASDSDDELLVTPTKYGRRKKRKSRPLVDILKDAAPATMTMSDCDSQDSEERPHVRRRRGRPSEEQRGHASGKRGRNSSSGRSKRVGGSLKQSSRAPQGETDETKSIEDSLQPAIQCSREKEGAVVAHAKTILEGKDKEEVKQQHWQLPVSAGGPGLHSCGDADTCRSACVAKAVLPHLDRMAEDELVFWYEAEMRRKFDRRSGEKVSGRIRRLLRAEARNALPASSSRSAAPNRVIVDLHLQNKPLLPSSVVAEAEEEEITLPAPLTVSPFDRAIHAAAEPSNLVMLAKESALTEEQEDSLDSAATELTGLVDLSQKSASTLEREERSEDTATEPSKLADLTEESSPTVERAENAENAATEPSNLILLSKESALAEDREDNLDNAATEFTGLINISQKSASTLEREKSSENSATEPSKLVDLTEESSPTVERAENAENAANECSELVRISQKSASTLDHEESSENAATEPFSLFLLSKESALSEEREDSLDNAATEFTGLVDIFQKSASTLEHEESSENAANEPSKVVDLTEESSPTVERAENAENAANECSELVHISQKSASTLAREESSENAATEPSNLVLLSNDSALAEEREDNLDNAATEFTGLVDISQKSASTFDREESSEDAATEPSKLVDLTEESSPTVKRAENAENAAHECSELVRISQKSALTLEREESSENAPTEHSNLVLLSNESALAEEREDNLDNAATEFTGLVDISQKSASTFEREESSENAATEPSKLVDFFEDSSPTVERAENAENAAKECPELVRISQKSASTLEREGSSENAATEPSKLVDFFEDSSPTVERAENAENAAKECSELVRISQKSASTLEREKSSENAATEPSKSVDFSEESSPTVERVENPENAANECSELVRISQESAPAVEFKMSREWDSCSRDVVTAYERKHVNSMPEGEQVSTEKDESCSIDDAQHVVGQEMECTGDDLESEQKCEDSEDISTNTESVSEVRSIVVPTGAEATSDPEYQQSEMSPTKVGPALDAKNDFTVIDDDGDVGPAEERQAETTSVNLCHDFVQDSDCVESTPAKEDPTPLEVYQEIEPSAANCETERSASVEIVLSAVSEDKLKSERHPAIQVAEQIESMEDGPVPMDTQEDCPSVVPETDEVARRMESTHSVQESYVSGKENQREQLESTPVEKEPLSAHDPPVRSIGIVDAVSESFHETESSAKLDAESSGRSPEMEVSPQTEGCEHFGRVCREEPVSMHTDAKSANPDSDAGTAAVREKKAADIRTNLETGRYFCAQTVKQSLGSPPIEMVEAAEYPEGRSLLMSTSDPDEDQAVEAVVTADVALSSSVKEGEQAVTRLTGDSPLSLYSTDFAGRDAAVGSICAACPAVLADETAGTETVSAAGGIEENAIVYCEFSASHAQEPSENVHEVDGGHPQEEATNQCLTGESPSQKADEGELISLQSPAVQVESISETHFTSDSLYHYASHSHPNWRSLAEEAQELLNEMEDRKMLVSKDLAHTAFPYESESHADDEENSSMTTAVSDPADDGYELEERQSRALLEDPSSMTRGDGVREGDHGHCEGEDVLNSPAGATVAEDRVLSLEEYVAGHQAEEIASQELGGFVSPRSLEEEEKEEGYAVSEDGMPAIDKESAAGQSSTFAGANFSSPGKSDEVVEEAVRKGSSSPPFENGEDILADCTRNVADNELEAAFASPKVSHRCATDVPLESIFDRAMNERRNLKPICQDSSTGDEDNPPTDRENVFAAQHWRSESQRGTAHCVQEMRGIVEAPAEGWEEEIRLRDVKEDAFSPEENEEDFASPKRIGLDGSVHDLDNGCAITEQDIAEEVRESQQMQTEWGASQNDIHGYHHYAKKALESNLSLSEGADLCHMWADHSDLQVEKVSTSPPQVDVPCRDIESHQFANDKDFESRLTSFSTPATLAVPSSHTSECGLECETEENLRSQNTSSSSSSADAMPSSAKNAAFQAIKFVASLAHLTNPVDIDKEETGESSSFPWLAGCLNGSSLNGIGKSEAEENTASHQQIGDDHLAALHQSPGEKNSESVLKGLHQPPTPTINDRVHERSPQGSDEYPLLLSQAVRHGFQDKFQNNDEELSLSNLATFPSPCKLEQKFEGEVEEISKSSQKLLSTQALESDSDPSSDRSSQEILSTQVQENESDRPHLDGLYNCAADSAWSLLAGEKNAIVPFAADEQSSQMTLRFSPTTDVEVDRIDQANLAKMQEEWQDAETFLGEMVMSFDPEDTTEWKASRKRKSSDTGDYSNRTPSQGISEESALDDDDIPTALTRAIIEKNVAGSADNAFTVCLGSSEERQRRLKRRQDNMLAREQQYETLYGHLPQSSGTSSEPNGSSSLFLASPATPSNMQQQVQASSHEGVPSAQDSATSSRGPGDTWKDLLPSGQLGKEDCSQDLKPPSKLPRYRKTISPLSQLILMRASSQNLSRSCESPPEKSTIRLKLVAGHENVIESPPSIEETTENSSQLHASSVAEPVRKFSLTLSPPSPVQVGSTDSSQIVSSQESLSSQEAGFQKLSSTKGILKSSSPDSQPCQQLCKCCAKCAELVSKAGTASNFISAQMKAFQSIAGNLSKEVQSLRSLVEAGHTSAEDPQKVKKTLKKSKTAEEMAEKALLQILRDSRRITKLTAVKPSSLRKIIFADEAGKKLCHVKTFQSSHLPRSILDSL